MSTGLDLPQITVTIKNDFFPPNFVNGLAKQQNEYTVVNSELAVLEFEAGFEPGLILVQEVHGTGFGYDENGRLTGQVTHWEAFEKDNPENGWSFDPLNSSLDRLNSLASNGNVTFQNLLVIPLVYNFVGDSFDDFYIFGSFDDIGYGYAGDDEFKTLNGDDTLYGHEGDDTLAGGPGDDLLYGGKDEDQIRGSDGADTIYGG